jgi:hypothetical protein
LHDHYIFCKKNEGENELGYMDMKNVFMYPMKEEIINNKKYFGIRFVKKKTYEELYSENHELI